ncbi:gluconate 2-dehydrogenase subunit 3 family protein [Novosphingobium sp. BL-8H]|uniref:gluconate 2-dehydrogenase subunit 3 family protein n=1 Tax=Novosphingobium sp. BL-8H TaxID=3127640 RepID=UPI003756499C
MTDAFPMDRRFLLGRIALLIGASIVPAEVFGAALKNESALSAANFSVLEAVCDTMVPATDTPGAVGAGVPAMFDGLLQHWASTESQEALIGAIEAVDRGAIQAGGKGFAALSRDERTAFLKTYDTAALKPVPRKEKLTGLAALKALPSVVDPHYARLKDLIVSLYYGSEVGLTQELVYEHVPGPWEPSIKITPNTRPFGSPGLF